MMAITRNIRKSTFDTKHAKIIQFTALWHPIGSFICYLHFFCFSISIFVPFCSLFFRVLCSLHYYIIFRCFRFTIHFDLFLRCTFIWETLVEEQQMKCDLSMKKKPRNSMKRMRKKMVTWKKNTQSFLWNIFLENAKFQGTTTNEHLHTKNESMESDFFLIKIHNLIATAATAASTNSFHVH